MLACYGGHVETVECLLAYMGATLPPAAVDINAMMFDIVSDGPGPSALHLAAACASDSERGAAVVAALLRAGAAAHPAGVLRALPPGSSRDPLGLLSMQHLQLLPLLLRGKLLATRLRVLPQLLQKRLPLLV